MMCEPCAGIPTVQADVCGNDTGGLLDLGGTGPTIPDMGPPPPPPPPPPPAHHGCAVGGSMDFGDATGLLLGLGLLAFASRRKRFLA
jgi:MYXO-CTERM domain-containing protein